MIEGALAKAGLALRIAVEAGGWEVVKRYAAMGFGISVIPRFCVQPGDRRILASRSVRSLFGQDAYGLVVKHGREPAPAVKALMDLIRPAEK